MKVSRTVITLTAIIAVLAFIAAALGVFWTGQGSPYEFHTVRGETVLLQGSGLYRYDTVSGAAQERAQDVVTLVVGLPLLLVSLALYRRGSLRGGLLLAGTLGYFLYTYASMAFLTAFNSLFLVYVAAFSLSLYAFVLTLMSIDVAALPARFSAHLPRRGIAALLYVLGGLLFLMWMGRIAPATLQGSAPAGLESYSTLVIQTMDLGLIVPLAFVAGTLLLRQRPFGYLLSSVVLLKGVTMGIALTAMIVGQLLAAVPVDLPAIIIFPLFAVVNIVMAAQLLRHVSEAEPAMA